MRRTLIALALTCVFSSSTLAGTIPTMGAPDPGPGATAPGDIASPGFTSPGDMGNGVSAALLTILDLVF
jgi:hypothetical protein